MCWFSAYKDGFPSLCFCVCAFLPLVKGCKRPFRNSLLQDISRPFFWGGLDVFWAFGHDLCFVHRLLVAANPTF